MNTALVRSVMTFGVRRGLSVLGAAGAAVSDEWVSQTVSLVILAGNELFQWWQAHKAEREKSKG